VICSLLKASIAACSLFNQKPELAMILEVFFGRDGKI